MYSFMTLYVIITTKIILIPPYIRTTFVLYISFKIRIKLKSKNKKIIYLNTRGLC
jgi:uncharacterized membrane protein